jgi:D-galactarolactone cycloisomerase
MPTISEIHVTGYEFTLPIERAYGMARGLNFRRTCALVEVVLDDGTVGYGEAGGPIRPLLAHLALVRPFFLKQSAFNFEIIATQIYNRLYHMGVQNLMTAGLSGISIALYDALGKHLGIPAHDLLGGKAVDKVPCYATTGYFTSGGSDDYERQLHAVAGKFRGVKIKIGSGAAADVDRARRARAILGDDVLLMVDMNGNYTVDLALESLRKLEPYGIHWCEEPLPPGDLRGYSELRMRSPVPLAAGEALYTVHDFKRLVDARGIDILQPSLLGCGGFGESRAIALLAQINNLRLSPSVWGGGIALTAALHFAASTPVWPHTDNVPYPMLVEYDVGENPFREKLVATPLPDGEGALPVPAGPGLGIVIDKGAVARLTIEG